MRKIILQIFKINLSVVLLCALNVAYAAYEEERLTTDISETSYANAVDQLKNFSSRQGKKLNIVVVYGKSGSGHKSAADAVESALVSGSLGEIFNVRKVDLCNDGVARFFTDYAMNYLCKNEHWSTLKLMLSFQGLAEKSMQYFQRDGMFQSLTQHQEPIDLIISVNFAANRIVYDIAKQNNIPFLLIPTDFEISNFVYDLHEIPEGDSFKILLPFYDDTLLKPLKEQAIENVAYTGYPTRQPFIDMTRSLMEQTADADLKLQEKKRVHEVKDGDHVIVINMGGTGVSEKTILNYISWIAYHSQSLKDQNAKKIHLFVVTGNNQSLYEKVVRLRVEIASRCYIVDESSQNHGNPNPPINILAPYSTLFMKIHPLKFQSAEDMAILLSPKFSDFMIGKTGGATTSELLVTGLPVLVHTANHGAMIFEGQNAAILKKIGQAEFLHTSSSIFGLGKERHFIEDVRPFFYRQRHAVEPMRNNFFKALPIEVMKSLQPYF